MEFNILTLFPEMFSSFQEASICKRALEAQLIDINLYNFREYSTDKHKRVDDAPFGGGAGMVIAPQSVFDCFADIEIKQLNQNAINVYMSASGEPLSPALAKELMAYDAVNILCGHYEGVDERIVYAHMDKEISIGDYVLTGGELPAMVLMDAVMRYVPGVLGNEESVAQESFSYDGLLEYPQYTRPADFRGMPVPEVLLSGHHANIVAWQRRKAIEKTAEVRPDLLKKAHLTEEEKKEFL
ncbi:MAG: tRNA (guanosine(37)-N1)-methyltransferase TrmD [Christensenellaceae bacterium]